jgi:hypothetical protein
MRTRILFFQSSNKEETTFREPTYPPPPFTTCCPRSHQPNQCKIIFCSGIYLSRSSAVRERYFCKGRTLVYKRTIVSKKLWGFLDISRDLSTPLGPCRCCSMVLVQNRSRLSGAFASLSSGAGRDIRFCRGCGDVFGSSSRGMSWRASMEG